MDALTKKITELLLPSVEIIKPSFATNIDGTLSMTAESKKELDSQIAKVESRSLKLND